MEPLCLFLKLLSKGMDPLSFPLSRPLKAMKSFILNFKKYQIYASLSAL